MLIKRTSTTEDTIKSTFTSLSDFINKNGDSPDNYIRNCRLKYESEREEFINRKTIKIEDIAFIKQFAEDYKQFLFLDWQNLVLKLIAANNKSVFYLFAFMKQLDILPKKEELKDITAFQKYQDLISDKEKLSEIFENDTSFKVAKFSASTEWQTIETKTEEKKFYVFSIECGNYVREADSEENKSVLDVATGVLLFDGFSFKGAFDRDEVIYLEVPNV